MAKRLAALMFHALRDGNQPTSGSNAAEAFYDVTSQKFGECLDIVARLGMETLTVQALDGEARKNHGVFVTFDDGNDSDYGRALPALLEKKMRGIFFVVSQWVGRAGFANANQLREMVELGMDVQAHGRSHRFLSELPPNAVREELVGAKQELEDVLGREVSALAYPGGRGNQMVRTIAAELGYRHFFCSRPGWYRRRAAEVPRMVVHGSSSLRDVECYLNGQLGPVLRGTVRYYAGRTLRTVLGTKAYGSLKMRTQLGKA